MWFKRFSADLSTEIGRVISGKVHLNHQLNLVIVSGVVISIDLSAFNRQIRCYFVGCIHVIFR